MNTKQWYFTLFCSASVLLSGTAFSKEWVATGPSGDAFDFIKINPMNAYHVYAVNQYDEIALSVNKGRSWALFQDVPFRRNKDLLLYDLSLAEPSSHIVFGYEPNMLLNTLPSSVQFNDFTPLWGAPFITQSIDQGREWGRSVALPVLTQDTTRATNISMIVVDPNNRLNIYGIVGYESDDRYRNFREHTHYWKQGVVKSNDGGLTWSGFSFLFTNEKPTLSIAAEDSALYMGANFGLYKSQDGGVSWQNIYQVTPFPCNLLDNPNCAFAGIKELKISKISSDIIYIKTSKNQYLRSDDGGVSWTIIFNQTSFESLGISVNKFITDPVNKEIIYATGTQFDRKTDKHYPIIGRSDDRGLTWKIIDLDLRMHRKLTALTIDPTDNKIIYLNIDGKVFISQNGLKSIQKVEIEGQTIGGALFFGKTDNVRFLSGVDGLYKTSQNGLKWEKQSVFCGVSRFDGFQGSRLLIVNPVDSNKLICIVGIEILYSDDAGLNWQESPIDGQLANGMGFTVRNAKLAADGMTGYAWNAADTLVTTKDGGRSWDSDYNPLMRGDWQFVATHPTLPKVALLVGSTQIYKTSNSGKHWDLLVELPTGIPQIYQLAYSKLQPEMLYALTEVGLFRSDDGGVSWVSLNVGLPQEVQSALTIPNINFRHSDLVTSHLSLNTLYLSFQAEIMNGREAGMILNKVYVSDDKGQSWRQVGGDVEGGQLILSPETDTPFVSSLLGTFELKN